MNEQTFSSLGLAPKLVSILDNKGLKTPTPIQAQAIPVALEGTDVMGIAQTGTGKTLAFGLPMLQALAKDKTAIGLIILPTRELALQVDESLQAVGHSVGLKTAVLIGGEPIHRQIKQLKFKPRVVIATPGRLLDHIRQQTITLDQARVVVLDEADQMLDMGFAPQIRDCLATVPKERQTMLFSATMAAEIVNMAKVYMKSPVRIEVAPAGSVADRVTQEMYLVPRDQKMPLLKHVLEQYKGSCLVFIRTKHGAKKVAKSLRDLGQEAVEIHSDRSQAQRQAALAGFKTGKFRVLVATDIAARGIDVRGIELVVNFDLPEKSEDYVHRIGRTGRAGQTGHAISFATPDQKRDIRDIERLTRTAMQMSQVPNALPQIPRSEASSEMRDEPRRDESRGGFRSSRSSFDRPRPDRGGYGRSDRPARPSGSEGRSFARPDGARPAAGRFGRPDRPNFSRGSSDRPARSGGFRSDTPRETGANGEVYGSMRYGSNREKLQEPAPRPKPFRGPRSSRGKGAPKPPAKSRFRVRAG